MKTVDGGPTFGVGELLGAYLAHQETHKEDRELARYHRRLYETLRDCSGVDLERRKRRRVFVYDSHVQVFENAVQHYLMAGRSPFEVPGLIEGFPCQKDLPFAGRIHGAQRTMRQALFDLMVHCLDVLEPDKAVAVTTSELLARGFDPAAKPARNWAYWDNL